ncbi:MAG: glucokinase [Candidatus Scalindua sp. AMX11]|nr:MAG: glucokinase [Candidatus Scalindua sp.]NOG82512.1 glucokinase [Planctomycetota bacterium]RZV93943.1 MAG: glucokinase [Candidatus Scalindua sp. SCAELEC01]TDE65563.1 MAG: glucokinase [Candidatus Scalindua sp. AMX11]GJQ58147.1 MAG: glucokinase [Candidatus Scalindua sp.]
MFLVGDVGGTKVRLALYELVDGRLVRRQTEKFMSSDYGGLDEVVRIFLDKNRTSVTKSCFGVPGPIINGEAHATNLPWTLREEGLRCALGIREVTLVNDLVATAAAVPHLKTEELFTLYPGKGSKQQERYRQPEQSSGANEEDAVFGVLAPGTGLGQAFLSVSQGKRSLWASEGGHVDFAPTSNIEIELFTYLQSRYGHVSYERLLSGPGLVNIYQFLKDKGHGTEPPELQRRLQEEDASFVISSSGSRGQYKLCVQALEIFASILGAQAGNMVLTMLATGGIYIGGGIVVNVYEKLAEGITVSAYLRKGRLAHLVEHTPLHIILDDHAALLGAASLASRDIYS